MMKISPDIGPMNITLHPSDLWLWSAYIQEIKEWLDGRDVPYRWEHDMRAWEYAFALSAIAEKARYVLDVGGGGSIFAPAAAKLGMDVVVVDPQPIRETINRQWKIVGKRIHFVQNYFERFENVGRMFDAAVCLSVIEHVPDHIGFFEHLLKQVELESVVALTTDFHPSGKAMCPHHLRTYNEESMQELIDHAAKFGFAPLGEVDYTYRGDFVNGYAFASLALIR